MIRVGTTVSRDVCDHVAIGERESNYPATKINHFLCCHMINGSNDRYIRFFSRLLVIGH